MYSSISVTSFYFYPECTGATERPYKAIFSILVIMLITSSFSQV